MAGAARREGNGAGGRDGGALSSRERAAVERFLLRVRRDVPAQLVQALLFGSKARGTARPGSDVDLLLIFRHLAPDREPHATIAEEIAEQVSREAGVPLGPWSVSLVDLRRGMRTPMLVDALTDGLPVWPTGVPVPRLPFTPEDALRCTDALLQRVAEGSEEVEARLDEGDEWGALRRARDDVVRMCTAALLLHGETRPRHARSVERFVEGCLGGAAPPRHRALLDWAARSFGPDGRDEEFPLHAPPGGFGALARLVDELRDGVARRRAWLERGIAGGAAPDHGTRR